MELTLLGGRFDLTGQICYSSQNFFQFIFLHFLCPGFLWTKGSKLSSTESREILPQKLQWTQGSRGILADDVPPVMKDKVCVNYDGNCERGTVL